MSNEKCCHHAKNEEINQLCVSIVPIFNHLTKDEMLEIVMTTQSLHLNRGELLYHAGDESDSLYIIHKGKVKIYRLTESGKEQLIRILEPGDFTGEMALFTESIHDSYAEAMTKTEICMIHRQALQEFLMKYPQISLKILNEFSRRLEQAEKQTTSIATADVEERLATYLLELCDKTESSNIKLPMSRKDLASYLGTTPETISRKLSSFEEEGWIEQVGQRTIRITDQAALEIV